MKKRGFLLALLLLSLPLAAWPPPATLAQGGDSCPAIVQAAVQTTDSACQETARNQACYGYVQAEALPQPDAAAFVFQQPGDRVPVADVRSLRLSALDEATGSWGVALLRIQASLPETLPGQNVTFVLFGDVELENAGGAQPAPPTLPVTATANANLRGGPSTDAAIVGSLAAGDALTADGRLADGSWLRVRLPEGGLAWVFAALVAAQGDLSTLAVVEPGQPTPTFGPMQAFYFRTGFGDTPCLEAPPSGILIQTPQGADPVTLSFNGVQMVLASTAFLQGGQAATGMGLSLLDGTATFPQYPDLILYGGQTQPWQPVDGTWGPLGDPQPLDADQYHALPLGLLPDPVTLYERHTVASGPYSVPTAYYPSAPGAPLSDWGAVLVHGRGLDRMSWDWLLPTLQDLGIHILTPDMPGHGQVGPGEPDYRDWPAVVADLAAFAQAQGIANGLLFGSSIGANSALVACAALPDWCRGAFLLSPGLDYFGVETPGPMQQMGDRPVWIVTSENDSRGGPGDVARQIAAYGSNVTLQIYPGDLHGTDLGTAYDLAGWLADYVDPADFAQPDARQESGPTLTPATQ